MTDENEASATQRTEPAHWLVIDDEESICWGFRRLAEQMSATIDTAVSAEEGLQRIEERRPDVVVLDVRLPGMDGLEALEVFRQRLPKAPVVVITAYGRLSTAVDAVRRGAFEYLTKPFDLKTARRVMQQAAGYRPVSAAGSDELPADEPVLVGKSPPMQAAFKQIALAAQSHACVYLRGETGTGKELAAREIHRHGPRAEGPFVAVNVAALSPSLAESELFGHVKGAFTGAQSRRRGLLEQAHGGTLFIDEVADIPASIQVKLLRALDYGEVLPVGADRPVQCDFRIISATHRDLAQRVAQGRFRHDLYFRLVTFEIHLPPLRERAEDIAPLADHFLRQIAAKSQTTACQLSREALEELRRRPWWGNVRELRNVLEYASIVARGGVIHPEHLPAALPPVQREADRAPADASADSGEMVEPERAIPSVLRRWAESQLAAGDVVDLHKRLLDLVEPPVLQAVLDHCGGRYAAAARILGLHRTTVRKRLQASDDEDAPDSSPSNE